MPDLDDLSSAFGRLFLRMHRLFDRRMAEQGASLASTKLLIYLAREGTGRAADVASYFGLAPRSVTEAIDKLERDGLVRREPDPTDRRAKQVRITDAGAHAIAATEPLRLQLVDEVFGSLDAADRADLARVVGRLTAALDAIDGGSQPDRASSQPPS